MYDRFKIIVTKDSNKDLIEMFMDSFQRYIPKNPSSVISK